MLFKAHELATAMCPAGWTRVRLAEIAQEVSVRAGHDTALPVLSVTKHRGIVKAEDYFSKAVHGRDTSNYKIVRAGDFAYATIHLDEGSLGRHTDTPSGIVSPMYTVFEVTAGFDPYYLETLLRSPKSIVTYGSLGQGTVNRRASISFSAFSGLVLQHPPLPEQKKIAAILSSVDEVIAKTEAVIAQLQIVKKAMMEQLLTKGMPGRHTRFKQTEIGEIPEEWEVVSLERAASRIVVGVVIQPASYYVPDGIPALRSLNVKDDEILLDKLVFFSDASNQQLSKSQIRTGDVLTVRTGVPGVSACVPAALNGANCIDLIITTPSAALRGEFLSRFINSDRGRGAILKRQGGLAQQHFNVGEMKQLLVPIPSIEEQDLIIERLQVIDVRLGVERALAKAITIVKAALSSSLLSGELRVIPEVAE